MATDKASLLANEGGPRPSVLYSTASYIIATGKLVKSDPDLS